MQKTISEDEQKAKKNLRPSPRPFPIRLRGGTIIEPTACSAPAIYPSAYPTRDDRRFGFHSRGTPVATHPQSPRQAQRPGCQSLPCPGAGVGRCRRRSGGGRDCPHGPWKGVLRRDGPGGNCAGRRYQGNQRRPRATFHNWGAVGETSDRRGPWGRAGGRDRTGGQLPHRRGGSGGQLWPHRDPLGAVAVPGVSGRDGCDGGASDAGTFADGTDFRRRGSAGVRAGARAGGRPGRTGGRNRPGGGGFSPTAVRCGMAFVQQVRGLGWEAAGAVAREVRNQVFAGEDFQEGIRAFREKRSPQWPSIREKR